MLKEFTKTYPIDATSMEKSGLVLKAKKDMGTKLFNMSKRVFKEFIQTKDRSLSGGYFKFAFVVGDSGQAPKKDVDYLWNRMVEIYGDSQESVNHIKRVLGTVCMICVAGDSRSWFCRIDPEKKEKLAVGQIPEATEYWMN